jgi:hypothetical protein
MAVYPCKACGAAENRPCVDESCPKRADRARDFRLHINSWKAFGTGKMPEWRIRDCGFEDPIPDNWREILEAGADG